MKINPVIQGLADTNVVKPKSVIPAILRSGMDFTITLEQVRTSVMLGLVKNVIVMLLALSLAIVELSWFLM